MRKEISFNLQNFPPSETDNEFKHSLRDTDINVLSNIWVVTFDDSLFISAQVQNRFRS